MTEPKFPLFCIVVHERSGGKYRIIGLPNPKRLLEAGCSPFYEYKCMETEVTWFRKQSEFEEHSDKSQFEKLVITSSWNSLKSAFRE